MELHPPLNMQIRTRNDDRIARSESNGTKSRRDDCQ